MKADKWKRREEEEDEEEEECEDETCEYCMLAQMNSRAARHKRAQERAFEDTALRAQKIALQAVEEKEQVSPPPPFFCSYSSPTPPFVLFLPGIFVKNQKASFLLALSFLSSLLFILLSSLLLLFLSSLSSLTFLPCLFLSPPLKKRKKYK